MLRAILNLIISAIETAMKITEKDLMSTSAMRSCHNSFNTRLNWVNIYVALGTTKGAIEHKIAWILWFATSKESEPL